MKKRSDKKWIWILLFLSICFTFCDNQSDTEKNSAGVKKQTASRKEEPSIYFTNAKTIGEIDKNIRSIFQDKAGNYWFGTNGAGVYRYNGKTLLQFTVKDGLSNNQVQSIQEDKSGNIWMGTGIFGVTRFDGQTFRSFATQENLRFNSNANKVWKAEPNDLWFYAGGGVYRFNGDLLDYLPLDKTISESKHSKNSANQLSAYAVYAILKDTKGNYWFGTQAKGVCCFNGESFTWFTESGLSGSAVLALFEDSKGNIWFGNNGAGLFCYNGKTLINLTEVRGLGNAEFKTSGKPGPGTLARIYAISEDNSGNLWIGTVDAGVWRLSGNRLINYTTEHGLSSNAVNTIYKDNKAELWFGTDGDGICKFNGNHFTRFVAYLN
jgi:ligand-binding sensor domain-containing protein